MSRQYILDGYNVLHSDRRWSDLSREKQRLEFLHLVEQNSVCANKNNTVTVVLDGYAASLEKIRLNGVRLVFSGDRDADTAIKNMVSGLSNPKEAVVVTNDRGIQAVVRRAGAQIMSGEEFFLLQKKKPVSRSGPKVDPRSAHAINEEFKRLWELD